MDPKHIVVPYHEEQLRGFVRCCAQNGRGRLWKEELNKLFRGLGSHFAAWRVWRARRRADTNGDGYIIEKEIPDLVKYVSKCNYTMK